MHKWNQYSTEWVSNYLLVRDSEHGFHLLKECAEVCNACVEECEKNAAMGMEHCKKCADACRACADSCSKHLNT